MDYDMAIVEKDYSNQELYWTGQDENWKYSDYQIEKTLHFTVKKHIYK